MDNKQVKIAVGGMLHDIGKILYRYCDGRNHSVSGYDFVKSQSIEDEEILDQIRFHHGKMLQSAMIPKDSLAYVTYWADNVAAGADRRNKDEIEEHVYDKFIPLESVFNVLNNNDQEYSYNMAEVYDSGEINYPTSEHGKYSEEVYGRILENIKNGIRQIELKESYVNSLLGVLEANLSFVPSSTDKAQLADISLFDHSKITAAIGACVFEYLQEEGVSDYRTALFQNAADYYDKKCFMMFSMDISGIQDFIYTVHSEGALKTLRSKSFYLEIMLEHIIDVLIERIGISRANLIYSGGGHAYLLLPSTNKTKEIIASFQEELNNWFIENFGTALYVACGYSDCSANQLMDKPAGTYREIFMQVSSMLSERKASRYSAEQILMLNSFEQRDRERECKVCGRVDRLAKEDICEFCFSLKEISSDILTKGFVSILSETPAESKSVLLPMDYYMVLEDEGDVLERLKEDTSYVRAYSKNKMFTGLNVSTKLWTGDYHHGNSFEELAEKSRGIKRIGIMRADVDNLGNAFARGFEREDEGKQYVSISRTATFSRKLNMFFKLHINHILKKGIYGFGRETEEVAERNALIVYSGGDDLFIVGAWNDMIEVAVDINEALRKYAQGTLTISAGIGLFPAKYPVKTMAWQTGELEDAAKHIDGKNAISVFGTEDNTYKWDVFQRKVIGEKYVLLEQYFSQMPEKGMAALYKLMAYIRNLDEKINLARLAYMLGRMEPERNAPDEIKELHKVFSKKLYGWINSENRTEECKQLLTAIYLYVYLHRERGGK